MAKVQPRHYRGDTTSTPRVSRYDHPEQDVIRRRSNWHNGYAYYCNGVFWANMSRVRVELV